MHWYLGSLSSRHVHSLVNTRINGQPDHIRLVPWRCRVDCHSHHLIELFILDKFFNPFYQFNKVELTIAKKVQNRKEFSEKEITTGQNILELVNREHPELLMLNGNNPTNASIPEHIIQII